MKKENPKRTPPPIPKTPPPIPSNYRRRLVFTESFKFYFTDKNEDYRIEDFKTGDKVNLWNKPGTDLIYVYKFGGDQHADRYLGSFRSNALAIKVVEKDLKTRAFIERISGNLVFLSSTLEIIDPQKEGLYAFEKDLELLKKPYRPQRPWVVSFVLADQVSWNRKVFLGHSYFEDAYKEFEATRQWEALLEHFWLVDASGKIISVENRTDKQNAIKLFRAIQSGYQFEIKYDSSEGLIENGYYWNVYPEKGTED